MSVRDVLLQTKDRVFSDVKATPEELDLAGWVAPDFVPSFRDIANKLPDSPLIIEIGTWKGASTNLMANILKETRKQFEIVAVDSFLGSSEMWTWGRDEAERGLALKRVNGYPTLYMTFLKNVILQDNTDLITPFPLSSVQAGEVLKYYKIQADAIYVDASHEENAVYSDLCAFWPLLKTGGIMFGDDWNWRGVQTAVERFAEETKLTVQLSGIIWKIHRV